MSQKEELFFQVINDIFSPTELESLNLPIVSMSMKTSHRVVEDIEWADRDLWESLYSHLPSVLFFPGTDTVCHPVGHGKRLRYIRQSSEWCERGPIHCDEIEDMSLFTDCFNIKIGIQLNVIIYLSDGFDGGVTRFYPDSSNYSKHVDVQPLLGRVVVFDRRLRHRAMPITTTSCSKSYIKDMVKFSVCYGHIEGAVDRNEYSLDEPLDTVHNELDISMIRHIKSLCKADPHDVSLPMLRSVFRGIDVFALCVCFVSGGLPESNVSGSHLLPRAAAPIVPPKPPAT